MRRNSIANAFTLLGRKPWLLLLLLPMEALQPLLVKLMPQANALTAGSPEAMLSYLGLTLAYYGVMLLLLLAAYVFLVPPAMELLRDGATGFETEAGWYGRGLRRHWWKPVALGAIEIAIIMAIVFVAFFIIMIVLIAVAIPMNMAASSASVSGMPFSPGGMPAVTLIVVLIPMLLLALSIMLISAYSSMLLPALADRPFGQAFRAVFSKRGFKKVLKLCLSLLAAGFVYILVFAAFGAAYVLLTGIPSSLDSVMGAIAKFEGSWTYFFVALLASVFRLFIYSYAFCLFREILDEEAALGRGPFQSLPNPPENTPDGVAYSIDEVKQP